MWMILLFLMGDPVSGTIGIEPFKEQLQGDVVLLDVRTPAEYEQGFIADAQLMNFNSPEFANQLENLDKAKTYLIYCRSGGRSGRALNLMLESGFLNVFDLQGGILAWEQAKQPLSQPEK